MTENLLKRTVFCFVPKGTWDLYTETQKNNIISRSNMQSLSELFVVTIKDDADLADGSYVVFETNRQLASTCALSDFKVFEPNAAREEIAEMSKAAKV